MTVGQVAPAPDVGPFPAPGSAAPGAPPALTRPLVSTDGARDTRASAPVLASPTAPTAPTAGTTTATAGPPPGPSDATDMVGWILASAMTGTALGLLAGAHRRRRP